MACTYSTLVHFFTPTPALAHLKMGPQSGVFICWLVGKAAPCVAEPGLLVVFFRFLRFLVMSGCSVTALQFVISSSCNSSPCIRIAFFHWRVFNQLFISRYHCGLKN